MNLAFLKDLSWRSLNPFAGRDEGILAVDIGSSSVKVAESVPDKSGYRIANVGIAPLPSTAIQNHLVTDKRAVADALRLLVRERRMRARKVVSMVPGRAVIMKKIQLPSQSEADLDAAVEFEAANVIPENLENVNLDYQVVGYSDGEDQIDILLVAVKKEIINSYTEAIEEAGLSPVIMDVDYFAMENMYESNYAPEGDEAVGLIHIGARYTSLNLLKNGLSTFTGDLPIGGENFTEALMQELKISRDQAETLKVTGALEGDRSVDLAGIVRPLAQSLTDDISHTLNLYGTMAAPEGLRAVYLSGGGANLAGIAAAFEEKLTVPVQPCDPFRNFAIAKSVDRDALSASALALALVAGLCVRRPGDK
jgi:type IV pilus assembly protein PilM